MKPNGSAQKNPSRKKIATLSACALWGISIILGFSIPANSPNIWIPDTALLLGFLPLIWICPFSLVWILFGVLTGFIGLFLLVLTNIPDSALPVQSLAAKKHLADYHNYWSWMIIGALVSIGGSIRLIINTSIYLLRRRKQSVPAAQEKNGDS